MYDDNVLDDYVIEELGLNNQKEIVLTLAPVIILINSTLIELIFL